MVSQEWKRGRVTLSFGGGDLGRREPAAKLSGKEWDFWRGVSVIQKGFTVERKGRKAAREMEGMFLE